MMHRLRSCVTCATLVLASLTARADDTFMFRALVGDLWLEGQPLTWDESNVVLLARDGQVHTFAAARAKQARKTSPQFVGLSPMELSQQLRREFGGGYQTTTSPHYVVVHPTDRGSEWAARFETLYRDFCRWVRVRGFDVAEPPYPLVAVVLPSEDEYRRHAAASGQQMPEGSLGHYDPLTNRVLLYDDRRASDWESTAATVIHEATHQTAFNVGVHARLAEHPRWVVEGLATLFEARGIYRAEAGDSLSDRINVGRLADFRQLMAERPRGQMQNLVASDTLFRTNIDAAYAESWALTLYLSETRGREYASYLVASGRKPMGTRQSPEARLAEFAAAFGSDLEMLEAKFVQWMRELR